MVIFNRIVYYIVKLYRELLTKIYAKNQYRKLPIKRPGRLFKNRSFRVGAYYDRALIWTRALIKKMKNKVIMQQFFSLYKVQRLDSHRFSLAVLQGNILRPFVYAVMQ